METKTAAVEQQRAALAEEVATISLEDCKTKAAALASVSAEAETAHTAAQDSLKELPDVGPEHTATLQAEVKKEEATSGDRLAELNREIDAIESRKTNVHSRLDDQLLRRYERVLARREGKAVVAAVGGKCSGCSMRLPPQLFILVQRAEVLQSCPNCQRFLYFVPPAEA